MVAALLMLWLIAGPRLIGSVHLDIHTIYYASLAVVIGFQSMLFWCCAKLYGMREGIVPPVDPRFARVMQVLTLETCLVTAGGLFVVGVALGLVALTTWGLSDFRTLSPERAMRLVIPSGTAILLAFQLAYGAFFLNILGIRGTPDA
jgi:hypothetical protein